MKTVVAGKNLYGNSRFGQELRRGEGSLLLVSGAYSTGSQITVLTGVLRQNRTEY